MADTREGARGAGGRRQEDHRPSFLFNQRTPLSFSSAKARSARSLSTGYQYVLGNFTSHSASRVVHWPSEAIDESRNSCFVSARPAIQSSLSQELLDMG
jgi:hypothetical protein